MEEEIIENCEKCDGYGTIPGMLIDCGKPASECCGGCYTNDIECDCKNEKI